MAKKNNVNLSGIGGAAVAGAQMLTGMVDNIIGDDIKQKANNMIDTAKAQTVSPTYGGDNFDAIEAAMNAYSPQSLTTAEDLGKKTGWNIASEALGSAATGAGAGAAFGGYGAAIGAGVGALTSLTGNLFGQSNYDKQAARINAAKQEVEAFNQRSFADRIANAQQNTLSNLEANYASYGGTMKHLRSFGGELNTQGSDFTNGLLYINNGGTHESNPYEGVPVGIDPQGVPNLVEEGETIFNDYVFSNRLNVPKKIRAKYKLRAKGFLSFADASKKLSKESEERPNDPISKKGLDTMLKELSQAQEEERITKQQKTMAKQMQQQGIAAMASSPEQMGTAVQMAYGGNKFDYGSELVPYDAPAIDYIEAFPELIPMKVTTLPKTGINFDNFYENNKVKLNTDLSPGPLQLSENKKNNTQDGFSLANLRYAPAVGSGITALTDALGVTNTPDFSEAEAIREAANKAGRYTPVSFNPIGNYLTYRPFDVNRATNKLNAEAAASRRAMLNTSGGNRNAAMAGILAADNNYLNQLGELQLKAEEANLAQRQRVEEFNRATNQANSAGFMQAATANQAAAQGARDTFFRSILAASELGQKERLASSTARSTNLSNFINSLGAIGAEEAHINMINSNPAYYYQIDPETGKTTYKWFL